MTPVAETGRAWALAINEHTSNRSLWQYVHDAYAHIEEDILVHGTGDRRAFLGLDPVSVHLWLGIA